MPRVQPLKARVNSLGNVRRADTIAPSECARSVRHAGSIRIDFTRLRRVGYRSTRLPAPSSLAVQVLTGCCEPTPSCERSHAIQLTRIPGDPFDLGAVNARFMGADRAFVLQQSERNLYPNVRSTAQAYFAQNSIGWWGGKRVTGHLLSSQVACVNHLFAWRQDSAAALAVLQGLDPDFVEALVVPGDRFEPGYVQF